MTPVFQALSLECLLEDNVCEGIVVDVDGVASYNECLQLCKQNEDECQWITFYEHKDDQQYNTHVENTCVQFANCSVSSNSIYEVSILTSEKDCDEELKCQESGQCYGTYESYRDDATYGKCMDDCRSNDECSYVSYFPNKDRCLLMEDCLIFDNETDPNSISSEHSCSTPIQTEPVI